jgi:glycosyltransferase involved in cell wall biosynthesis
VIHQEDQPTAEVISNPDNTDLSSPPREGEQASSEKEDIIPVLIHVLSLDTIGGVEALYIHYLQEALSRGTAIHFTSVCGKPPQKAFSEHFESIGHRPFLEEYVCGVRLPRFLRSIVHIRRSMVQGIVNPTYWVFWNRIESQCPSGEAIYYEHGGAWNLAPTKGRRKFLAHCAHYIANSQAAAIMLKEKWHVNRPIHVIPNPLRPDIPIIETPRKPPQGNVVRLGCIGRLVPVKGTLVALHALKILLERGINATLSIAGEGHLENTTRKLADRLGITKSVIWNGRLSSITGWFDSIDILLVPSIREPLGLVALEAAARGAPVIAAGVDGLPEAVLDKKTGLCLKPTIPLSAARDLLLDVNGLPDLVVDPASCQLRPPLVVDPSTYADAIELLINDPTRYTEYSANAIIHAKSRSDFTAYYNALSELFEKSVLL